MKQRKPKSVVEAISFTIEVESYLPKPVRVLGVESDESVLLSTSQELSILAVQEKQSLMIEKMAKRLERLEEHLADQSLQSSGRDKDKRATGRDSIQAPVICHKCKKEGQYARGCAANRFGKLETLGAVGQAHEAVSQVPKTIIFTVNPVTVFQVQGMINLKPVVFMIDTGAAVSLVSLNCWHEIRRPEDMLDKHYNTSLMGVDGSTLQVAGTTNLKVHFEGQVFVMSVVVVESLQAAAIMGKDFLEVNQCVVDVGAKSLQIKGLKCRILLVHPPSTSIGPYHTWAILPSTIQIPGNSELEVMAK